MTGHKSIFRLIAALSCVFLFLPGGQFTFAQGLPQGQAISNLNLRAGPGEENPVIAVLPRGAVVTVEGRNTTGNWVLVTIPDLAARGWVATRYLRVGEDFQLAALPVVENAALAAPAEPAAASAPIDLDAVIGQLQSLPVVPTFGSHAYEIFALGQSLGNDRHFFAQVGDCNSLGQEYLNPFAAGRYSLGPYGDLRETIDFFSFVRPGLQTSALWHKGVAVSTGFTALMIVDPAWSDPQTCAPDTSPLECEYDLTHPSAALIMIGLFDVYWLSPAQYEEGMRRIIEVSIERGVIPILTTFPTRPGDHEVWPSPADTRNENRLRFNGILIRLAGEYDVPLINLWRATHPLPWSGLGEWDFIHLSVSPYRDDWASFNGQEALWGVTMWNLVTLQTLDRLRRDILAN